jgi:hypothetical protein
VCDCFIDSVALWRDNQVHVAHHPWRASPHSRAGKDP